MRSEETFILQSYHLVENELISVLHFDWLRDLSSEIILNNIPGACEGESCSRSNPLLARFLNELRNLCVCLLGGGEWHSALSA